MKVKTEALGVEHLSIHIAMVNMALSFRKQGRLSDPEELLRRMRQVMLSSRIGKRTIFHFLP